MIDAVHIHPWQVAVQAKLTRGAGAHRVEEIRYGEDGRFTRTARTLGSVLASDHIFVLEEPALVRLLAELQTELELRPIGVDAEGLTTFIGLIQAALGHRHGLPGYGPPQEALHPMGSHRFDAAQFGVVTSGDDGTIYGHLRLGIDIAGTIVDSDQRLCFEQHLITEPYVGGSYRMLSAAEQASLCRALRHALDSKPPANGAWRRILHDAEAGSKQYQ